MRVDENITGLNTIEQTIANSSQPKIAPQLGQRLSLIAKQHKIPIGKKTIAQQTPKQV